jgi:hypothetical protein
MHKESDLTAATMTRTLEAALVFSDSVAATETLAALGQQRQFPLRKFVINTRR